MFGTGRLQLLTANAFFGTPVERLTAHDEARFFEALKTGNDTFKLTGRGRLRSVDAALARRLQTSGSRLREALDLGISSGVTTLELCETLRRCGQTATVTGTDRSFEAWLVDLPMGCRALIEPRGHVLQYEVLGRPLKPWRRRLDYLTGMLAVRGAVDRLLRRAVAARAADLRYSRPVTLISPRLAASNAALLVEDDVMRRNPAFAGRFDLVRAANILNWSYFNTDEMTRAIDNILSYLSGPGAWLLIVRSRKGGVHDGTLFRLKEDGLNAVERFGGGSEIEALVLDRSAQR